MMKTKPISKPTILKMPLEKTCKNWPALLVAFFPSPTSVLSTSLNILLPKLKLTNKPIINKTTSTNPSA